MNAQSNKSSSLLRAYESRNMLFIEPDGSWPIVWERAKGVRVWDADGKKYLDLTAAFGVAAAGHANPRGRARPGSGRWAAAARHGRRASARAEGASWRAN